MCNEDVTDGTLLQENKDVDIVNEYFDKISKTKSLSKLKELKRVIEKSTRINGDGKIEVLGTIKEKIKEKTKKEKCKKAKK